MMGGSERAQGWLCLFLTFVAIFAAFTGGTAATAVLIMFAAQYALCYGGVWLYARARAGAEGPFYDLIREHLRAQDKP